MESIHVQWRSDSSMAGVLIMKFATGYLVCLFAALFCAAQFADHLAAKMCTERTIMSYDQCRQLKP